MTVVKISVGGDEVLIEAAGAKADALVTLAVRALAETRDHPRRVSGTAIGFQSEIAGTAANAEMRAGRKR